MSRNVSSGPFQKRWKVGGESFPQVFEIWKTGARSESYDPLKSVKIQRKKNVDLGEKSPKFCMDRVSKSPHSGNEKKKPGLGSALTH